MKTPNPIMTLILTEITENGIAMATDSLWTRCQKRSRPGPKLFPVPYLNAAVSTWGGTPGDYLPQHEWIRTFIEENEDCESVAEFGEALEEQAVSDFGMLKKSAGKISGQPRASLGFHVAGYDGDQRVFFNINNNPSRGKPELEDGDKTSVKLEDWRDEAEKKPRPHAGWLIRNGDWEGFAVFFDMFKQFRIEAAPDSDLIKIPYTGKIEDHGKYLGLMILFIGGIWQLSNMSDIDPSHIGGFPHVLTMTQEGVNGGGRKKLKMTGAGLVLR